MQIKSKEVSSSSVIFLAVVSLLFIILVILLFQIFNSNGFFQDLGSGFDDFIVYQETTSTSFDEIQAKEVVKITDGDTIKLDDGSSVRYLNVDTPETKKPNSPIECFGPEASEFNSRLVADKTVYLTFDKRETDRYNRKLQFVFLNPEDTADITKSVNAQLVKYGFAKALIISPNNTYADIFYGLEIEARDNNLGLWAECE